MYLQTLLNVGRAQGTPELVGKVTFSFSSQRLFPDMSVFSS
jgi:hypothetical protein